MSDNEQKNGERVTIADVIAIVREVVKFYEREAEKSKGQLQESFALTANSYKEIANLIEAAWKQEKAEIEANALAVGGIVEAARTAEESSAVGNAKSRLMTLDEAIAHAEDVANTCDTSCGREHRQLANWLKELREMRHKPVGNAAAMREALSDACYAMSNFLKTQNGGYKEMANALDKAKFALSEPARNCDVGTAEEQEERFADYCCDKCDGVDCKHGVWREDTEHKCALEWEQMPYEAQEGGAK